MNGLFYVTSMAMMGNSSPLTYPRIFWVSSPDLKNWSDPVWYALLSICVVILYADRAGAILSESILICSPIQTREKTI